jgi:hypothetical protein
MFIVYGVYHLWPKRVGFRNDYCLGCDKPRRSFAMRTFDVGHLFWIPFLPVGFWKHWKCSECGRDPHVQVKTRRSFKWVGFGCLVLLSGMFWLTPIGSNDGLTWFVRIASAASAALLLMHLLRTPAEPSLKDRLANIQPAADVVCPFCTTILVASSDGPWICPACSCARY